MQIENIKRDNIEKIVKEIIAGRLNISIEKIKTTSFLKEDLGLDSFGAVEVAFELEEKFRIRIPQEDLNKIKKIEDIIEYISNRR
jgi:acyl carrier protein